LLYGLARKKSVSGFPRPPWAQKGVPPGGGLHESNDSEKNITKTWEIPKLNFSLLKMSPEGTSENFLQ
jgi:hypothetical protein